MFECYARFKKQYNLSQINNIHKLIFLIMKKSMIIICSLFLVAVSSCKENPTGEPETCYASTEDFFIANASPMQVYYIDGTTGGSITTPKGTVITIPADAFINQNGDSVVGNVQIKFKDVYKKSEMVLNLLSTHVFWDYAPLKSAGMFYFKAGQESEILELRPGKSIMVSQPLNGLPIDTAMRPYWLMTDGNISGWAPVSWGGTSDSLTFTNTNYIYILNSVFSSGSWYNTDNPDVFAAYPQTTLIALPPSEFSAYSVVAYLYFSDINTVIKFFPHSSKLIYNYAPVGLGCMIIALGIKDQKMYASFTPITIVDSMTVNFPLSETTEADFLTQLNSLN